MTVVIEAAVVPAVVGALGSWKKYEKKKLEERATVELYERFFHADLFEIAPDRITVHGSTLTPGVDPHVAACVRVIEQYQKERKSWFMGLSSTKEHVGDMRTRILEEMKQWLMTVSNGKPSEVDVLTRLEYCRQVLLRPAIYEGSNVNTFLSTLAQVCKQLEGLHSRIVGERRNGAEKIGRLVSLGRDIVCATLPVLVFALGDSSDLPTASATKGPPESVEVAKLLEAGQEQSGSSTDIRRTLWALLGTDHFCRLVAGKSEGDSEDNVREAVPVGGREDRGNVATNALEFSRVLEDMRQRWETSTDTSLKGSGLLPAFQGPRYQELRGSYLDLVFQLDRLAFFMGVLQPYHRLACSAGDIAMCRLYESLSHLLQEIEDALVQQRQARHEVMRGAKRHLQVLGARFPGVAPHEVHWMQGLRHIDDPHLDELYCALISVCTELRVASSGTRAFELQAAARQGLRDVFTAFNSPNFQSRCALALPEGLIKEIRQMALAADAAPPVAGRPLALTPP